MTRQLVTGLLLLNIFLFVSSVDISPAAEFLTIETPSLKGKEEISNFVNDAAQIALTSINEKRNASNRLEIKEVESSGSQIGEGILYSFVLELDYGMKVAYEFVQPVSIQSTWMRYGLPTSPSDSLVNVFRSPRMSEMTFEGPIHLTFPKSRDDIRLWLPKEVDAGSFKRIKVNPGVQVQAHGISELRLVNPIEIELSTRPPQADDLPIPSDGERFFINWKQLPTVEIKGNSLSFHSEQRIKVKRKDVNEVEFNNGTTSSNTPHKMKVSLDLANDNPLVVNLKHALNQYAKALASSTATPLQAPSLRRLVAGSAKAVTLLLVPLELEEEKSGLRSLYDVVVSQDYEGNRKLISSRERMPVNELSILPSVMANNTIPHILENLKDSSKVQAIDVV